MISKQPCPCCPKICKGCGKYIKGTLKYKAKIKHNEKKCFLIKKG